MLEIIDINPETIRINYEIEVKGGNPVKCSETINFSDILADFKPIHFKYCNYQDDIDFLKPFTDYLLTRRAGSENWIFTYESDFEESREMFKRYFLWGLWRFKERFFSPSNYYIRNVEDEYSRYNQNPKQQLFKQLQKFLLNGKSIQLLPLEETEIGILKEASILEILDKYFDKIDKMVHNCVEESRRLNGKIKMEYNERVAHIKQLGFSHPFEINLSSIFENENVFFTFFNNHIRKSQAEQLCKKYKRDFVAYARDVSVERILIKTDCPMGPIWGSKYDDNLYSNGTPPFRRIHFMEFSSENWYNFPYFYYRFGDFDPSKNEIHFLNFLEDYLNNLSGIEIETKQAPQHDCYVLKLLINDHEFATEFARIIHKYNENWTGNKWTKNTSASISILIPFDSKCSFINNRVDKLDFKNGRLVATKGNFEGIYIFKNDKLIKKEISLLLEHLWKADKQLERLSWDVNKQSEFIKSDFNVITNNVFWESKFNDFFEVKKNKIRDNKNQLRYELIRKVSKIQNIKLNFFKDEIFNKSEDSIHKKENQHQFVISKTRKRNNEDFGRKAEQEVYKYFSQKLLTYQLSINLIGSNFPFVKDLKVEWNNKNEESYLPYDMVFKCEDFDFFIDVKATRGTKDTIFYLSIAELKKILEDPKRYAIARVYYDEDSFDDNFIQLNSELNLSFYQVSNETIKIINENIDEWENYYEENSIRFTLSHFEKFVMPENTKKLIDKYCAEYHRDFRSIVSKLVDEYASDLIFSADYYYTLTKDNELKKYVENRKDKFINYVVSEY